MTSHASTSNNNYPLYSINLISGQIGFVAPVTPKFSFGLYGRKVPNVTEYNLDDLLQTSTKQTYVLGAKGEYKYNDFLSASATASTAKNIGVSVNYTTCSFGKMNSQIEFGFTHNLNTHKTRPFISTSLNLGFFSG